MFLEAALLGVLIGWLRKGKLQALEQVTLIGWPVVLLSLAIQVAVWIDFFQGYGYLPACAPYLHLFSYLPLIVFAGLNRKTKAILVIGIGITLNLLVIAANGGFMPVKYDRLAPGLQAELLSGAGSPFHIAMSEESRLSFLGDLFRLPYGKYRVISIGDIIMAAGICLLIQGGMMVRPPQKER